jgi:hypothetical protein
MPMQWHNFAVIKVIASDSELYKANPKDIPVETGARYNRVPPSSRRLLEAKDDRIGRPDRMACFTDPDQHGTGRQKSPHTGTLRALKKVLHYWRQQLIRNAASHDRTLRVGDEFESSEWVYHDVPRSSRTVREQRGNTEKYYVSSVSS